MITDDKNLGAWDLEVNGKYEPKEVTIERFFQDTLVGQMGKESKVFVKLKEFDKPMVCNRTNFKRLETFFKSFNPDDYVGKSIVLGVEKVSSPEGKVDALRFSTRPIPPKVPVKPPIKDEDFPKAIEAVKKGTMTADKLKETRSLTPQQIEQLDAL